MENVRILREDGKHDGSYFYHINDGFHYQFERETFTTIYFKCVHSSKGCEGRALMRNGEPLTHTVEHDHGPNVLYCQLLAHRQDIVRQARTMVYVSFSEILESERRRIGDRTIRAQLTLRILRPAMQRARASQFPNIPRNLMELTQILEDPQWHVLTRTVDQQDNIYLGSITARDGSHNVLFISRRCLEVMQTVDILFADGTFYIAPAVDHCYQVLSMVTIWGHTVIPLFWCLMERKTEHAYIAVLQLLRARLVHWNFNKVVTDFEDAMINAFRLVFQVPVQGCLFHATDAMGRYARTVIGIPILLHFPHVKDVVRHCCALPLLPHHLLQRGMNIIGAEALQLGDVLYRIVCPFLEYVQRDWLNHANRGVTMSVCGSYHRTNNASESNNRRMKRRFGVHHPNIYYFIRQLVLFEDVAIDDLTSLRSGNIPSRHRSVSAISNDVNITRLTNDLLNGGQPSDDDIRRFLHAAAYRLERAIHEAIGIPLPRAARNR